MHFTELPLKLKMLKSLSHPEPRENLKKADEVDPTAAARAYRRQHRTREEHERPELPLIRGMRKVDSCDSMARNSLHFGPFMPFLLIEFC